MSHTDDLRSRILVHLPRRYKTTLETPPDEVYTGRQIVFQHNSADPKKIAQRLIDVVDDPDDPDDDFRPIAKSYLEVNDRNTHYVVHLYVTHRSKGIRTML